MKEPHDIPKEFQSVLGYYELGMWDEALAEVDEIEGKGAPPTPATRLEFNELRLVVYQGARRWAAMRELAEASAEQEPSRASWFISWAFALRREESIPAARAVLERAQRLHPAEALIPFNLACYAAQTGKLGEARLFLARALKLDPELEKNAREDDDLAPLRQAGAAPVAPPSALESEPEDEAPSSFVPIPYPSAPAPAHDPAPAPPAEKSRASSGSELPAIPTVPAALRVYVRNLREGDAEARAVALLSLVTAKAEGILATLLASEDPAVAKLAGQGLRECWLNETGSASRKRLEKGIAAMERGDYGEAEEAFRALMGSHPRWAEATHQMAILHFRRHRVLESLALARRVVELKPDHFDAWGEIAAGAVQLGLWPVALDAAKQCLRLQPRHRPHQEMVQSLQGKVKQ